MKRGIFLVFIAFFTILTTFAQQNWKEEYDRAKQVFLLQKYETAMDLFLPVTSPDPGNSYSSYAQYYYSLSAFNCKRFKEARQMLLQLLNRDPNWRQNNEAEYLLAATYFEMNQYRFAINAANTIKGMTESVSALKKNYYALINPIDTIIPLQRDYPDDVDLAEALFNKLSTTSLSDAKNKMLYDYLIQEYKFKPKSIELSFVKKTSYHVAVLFPFNLNEITGEESKRNNHYITDMYEGILIGIDSLKKKGITVIIHPYDIDKDVLVLQKILNYPELKSMDLIIGPLFPALIPYVTAFSEANKIPVINPISINSKVVEKTTMTLLFQPALEAVAGRVSSLAKEQFIYRKNVLKDDDLKPKMNAIIFYTSDPKDSLLALYYRDSLLSKGFNVPSFIRITKSNIPAIGKIFSDSLALLQTSHIFVSSSDPALASNVISGLEISRQTIPIITKSDWLDINNQTYDQYERRKVYFIYPDFVDFTNKDYIAFKGAFIEKYHLYPTKYSVLGYELINLIGGYMNQYGTGYYYYMTRNPFQKGHFMAGFDFSKKPYNTYVPVYYFNELKLTLANPNP